MAHLSLVKSLSHLREEQRHSEEILLDGLGLALTRGTIVEMAGAPSSGKTSVALSVLARLTGEGEVCAVVDSCGGFDPYTATAAGVELENLLWIRCGGDVEKSFLAADYLVQAKGFGCVWLNLNGIDSRTLRYVPKTYWYRYRTRIRETPTVFIVTASEPVTASASHSAYVFSRDEVKWSEAGGRFRLIEEFHIRLASRKHVFGPPLRTKVGMDYTEL